MNICQSDNKRSRLTQNTKNLPPRSRIHFGCRGVAIDCLPSCVGIGDAYGNECAGLTLLNVA